jgi:glycosyltransferase involved in cell wall biosynthesis
MVATVSEASRQDILEARLTKRPLVVIPNAPRDLSQFLEAPVEAAAAPKNLVYMGTFMRYKNVEALIAAMEFLPSRTLHLLSPITKERKAELMRCIPKNAKVVFHNGVSDKKYAQLLADDAVLVKATRDEGFCLPLAEALALGVPAVVSDLPVLHEVAGEGALYFKCNSPQDFANQVEKLESKKLMQQLSKAGKRQMERYTWKKSAQTLLDAMKSLG